jgi:deoxycytidine triphosphate deaminase
MTILIDKDLVELVKNGRITSFDPLPTDWFDKNSPVQASSIDLHIGKIFIPEEEPGKRGCINKPKEDYHTLLPGETALVESTEILDIPKNISGFGFPPASIAVKGILMTNPGHIDPGFKGNLTFTLINMGKEPFTIRRGDTLFTTLWNKHTSEVQADYFSRTRRESNNATEATLDVLCKDFLDINRRAESKAKKVITKSTFFATVFAIFVSFFASIYQHKSFDSQKVKNDIKNLERAVTVLETKSTQAKETDELKKMVNKLNTEVTTLRNKLNSIESKP